MNAVKFRSLPVSQPEQLRNLKWVGENTRAWVRNSYIKKRSDGQWLSDAFSHDNFSDMRDQATRVTDVMGHGTCAGHGGTH